MMRLTDCELRKLLPLFMRQEKDDLALASGIDQVIRYIGENITLCSDWGVIDRLPEEFLDELAWELDIEWYDKSADIDVKRSLVKNADIVHSKNGTKAAIVRVVSDYYDNAIVEEWFEYGGAPGHFRVTVLSEDMHIVIPDDFVTLITKIKRQSAIFDSVDYTWTTYQTLYTGTAQYQSFLNSDIVIETGL